MLGARDLSFINGELYEVSGNWLFLSWLFGGFIGASIATNTAANNIVQYSCTVCRCTGCTEWVV